MKDFVRLFVLLSAMTSICHATTVVILYDGQRILYGTDTRSIYYLPDGVHSHDDVCKAFLSDKYVVSKVGFLGFASRDAQGHPSGGVISTEEYDRKINQVLIRNEPPDLVPSQLERTVESAFGTIKHPPFGSVSFKAFPRYVELVYTYFDGDAAVADLAKEDITSEKAESSKFILTKDEPASPTHAQEVGTDPVILQTSKISDPVERLKAILHRMHELDPTNIGDGVVIASITRAGGKWIEDDRKLCASNTHLAHDHVSNSHKPKPVTQGGGSQNLDSKSFIALRSFERPIF